MIELLTDFLVRHGISTSLIENDVLALLQGIKEHLNIVGGPWVAGGSVLAMLDKRGLTGRDVDFFFSSREQMEQFEKTIKDQVQVRSSITTGNATTIETRGEKLQFIFRDFYSSPHDVIESFDFSICKFATDGEHIAYTEQAYEDWRNKILRFENTHKEPNSVDRYVKYSLHGYTTDLPTYTKIMEWLDESSDFFSVASSGY